MATTFAEAFIQSPTTATAEIDGQLVALDVRAGICFGLDPIATTIWKLLDRHRSVEELVEVLLELYEVDRVTCAEQTGELLQELAEIGLASRA
ncbi:PqqD family protein [Novosphingobium resinovorum]|uniref:PqqD family protein n=1 Tax=Novosphingobium resinovorum TaxID=158500 RepID=UPI002ED27BFA|nr:PqqD family protein [Novosphingobium resinovorum]